MLRPDFVDGDAFDWMLRHRVGKELDFLDAMKDALEREGITAKARNPGKKTGGALLRGPREGPGECLAETTGKPADDGNTVGSKPNSRCAQAL